MASEDITIEDIDESQLTAENGEVYLFQYLEDLASQLTAVTLEYLKSQQSSLETSLVKVITAPAPYPAPGRAIRNVVTRCLTIIYKRAESRTLFDTLQAFLKIVGDFKSLDKDVHKIAAFWCIGNLMSTFGSQYMSFMAEIATVTLKTVKSSNSPSLRYHAFICLREALGTARRAVPDTLNKDILKQGRNGLSDKALPVQRGATEVLIAMHSEDGDMPSVSEVDSIVNLCIRSLETADQVTRHALAQLVGHMLASTQKERPVPVPEANQKARKEAEPGDADLVSPSVPTEVNKPLLTTADMFSRLSTPFNRSSASKKTRIGIFDFYAALLTKLGSTFAESNYSLIASHLLSDIATHSRNNSSRYERLLVRSLIGILLRDLIGIRMLSEQGQIGAIQELANSCLKRWPAMMPGQVAPNSTILVICLREVAGLLQQLGNAPPPVQDAVAEPLINLLAHPSHTVRVTSSWALRCFCYSTPLRLPKAILTVMELLQRDLSSILSPAAPSDINSRTLGHAYGLASLVSVVHERPLYVSYDISAKVLDMATQLLKRAGEHDVKLAAIEVEVAWTSIASLMSLGPNFVRPHLQQLLVLWRNALPKPTSKDASNNAIRPVSEWMFLLHVRESALGAMLCFLQHNMSTLVTLDVARRISSVLSNALTFANNFISQNVEDPTESQIGSAGRGMGLRARESLLRRRVYQCFAALGFNSIVESTQITLLQSVVSLFASPDGYIGSNMQAAIASGSFTSVWQSIDGYAYGVTFLEVDSDSGSSEADQVQGKKDHLNRDAVEVSIDDLLRKPILGACEHDPLSVCHARLDNAEYELPEPPPPATAVVDTSIELFARLLPLQDRTSVKKIITLVLESVGSPKLEKNIGRKAAVNINAAVAIALALRQAMNHHARQSRETFGHSEITNLLSIFLKGSLIDGDLMLRSASSESIGRLASLSDTNFLASQIKSLVDLVVNNRDPNGRAGCALAFGAIYSHVGGLAAGPLLKTTVNVLMTLGNDPHPIVHFWALNALARVTNAASLAYAQFVPSTLGMLLKVYLLESHEREGGTLSNANLSGDFPAYPVVCQIIDAVITVLGPDMQESTRTRALVFNLVKEFSREDDEGIRVEAIKCFQHFLMFSPESVDIPDLVHQFRSHLSSSRRSLKLASINALYQLVQKDALMMSKLGGDSLVEELFGMLDDDASVQGVRNVISSWLQQTVALNPSAWIDLCQRIMSRTTASQQVADAANRQNMNDDEGESLNVGLSDTRGRTTSRWRTQLFSLQCLHSICSIVARSGRREHLDIAYARKQGLNGSLLLVTRVPDLIKMAFTASTAYVTEIRLEGLVVLQDVIQIFSTAPDPAYEDALLLEQHQAPITAALTPAFSSDSTPEILSAAVHACAVFVGCGVVKDVSRMGRILKLLTTALEQCKESGMLSLGETGELSPNASAMLRISTLSAWAQLEVSGIQQAYLKNVVKPYRAILAEQWIGSLRDYASIKVDSEFSHDTSSSGLDSSYSSLGKEVLLPYYGEAWSVILQAVATAMQSQDPFILAAMDGLEISKDGKYSRAGVPRDEPTAFFYVIFGLVYEALSTSSVDSSAEATSKRPIIISCLQALKYLVQPAYSGGAILQATIFDEFISLCYRLAMTEPASVQVYLAEMLACLATTQDIANADTPDALSITSPRAHCLRICAHILRHSVASNRGPVIQGDLADRVKMITASFSAFASVATSITTVQREDVRGIACLLYSDLLKDESSEVDLVGPTLPALKALLEFPTLRSKAEAGEQYRKTVHGLMSACLVNVDSVRGREGHIISKKIKNNLLAAVLILTVVPPSAKLSISVIEHICFLITENLLEAKELTLTSGHCARTLVVASASKNVALRECSRLLIPGLIEFVAKMVPLVHEQSISEAQIATLGEVWKAFSAFYASVPDEQKSRALGILLPTVILLLSSSQKTSSPVVSQSVSQVLSYASASPAAFKEATEKLDVPTRELLEQVVRRAVGNTGLAAANQAAAKPQISLRSF